MSTQLNLEPVEASFSLKDHIYRVLKTSIMELDIYDPATSLRMDERRLAERLGISRTPVREALMRLEQEGFVETRARRGVFIRRKSLIEILEMMTVWAALESMAARLAERLGISRTPVREALMRLEQEGFVETRARRGVFIRRKSQAEILEMMTVWAALESMAARLACTEASDAEIAELRRIGASYTPDQATAHIQEYSETNIEFHLCILKLSRCRMLQEIAEGLFTHLKAVRRKGMADTTRAERSVVDHMAIIQAIEARNEDLAGDLVRDHTMRLRDYIRASWKDIAGGTAD